MNPFKSAFQNQMAALFSYGACQTACNAATVVCYSAAGLTFGTVTGGVSMPAAAVACNSALGACMSTCASKFLVEGAAETAVTGGSTLVINAVGGLLLAGAGAAGWQYFKRG